MQQAEESPPRRLKPNPLLQTRMPPAGDEHTKLKT